MIDDTTSGESVPDEYFSEEGTSEVIQNASPSWEGPDPIPDTRLYVPDHVDWDVQIMRGSERAYCFSKLPGQDWFHLILSGEIYVTRQHERYCLSCALRMGFLTQDRLFWQHRVPKRPQQHL